MRVVFLLLALLFAAIGILFGALNPQPVAIDFYWWQFSASLGAAFLSASLAGVVLGGLAVVIGVVWPLRRRLQRANRTEASRAAADASATALVPLPHDPGAR